MGARARRWPGAALALVVVGIGCGAYAGQGAVRPRPALGLDLARCLAAVDDPGSPEERACPGFLVEALRDARDTCRGVSGQLVPADVADVWAIDVNGDGIDELTLEHAGNVACDGAASLFSCGSLGCPILLFERGAGRDGAWRPIASIWADAPTSIEAVPAALGGAYRDLVVTCESTVPCEEHWYHVWTGSSYEGSHVLVRGHRVNFAGSVHGLHALVVDSDVLAEPDGSSRALARHVAGTEVAIVGTADGAEFYYVSPCNACERGFVPRSAAGVGGSRP